LKSAGGGLFGINECIQRRMNTSQEKLIALQIHNILHKSAFLAKNKLILSAELAV
jgi:hypothetical protein